MSHEEKDIEKIDHIVQKALEMLMGAGGHRAGIAGLASAIFESSSSLKNTFNVVLGVTADHWHMGYKDIVMQSFQRGLQKLYEDYYISLKILEPVDAESFSLPENMQKKLSNKENRIYILKLLGLTKEEIKAVEESIADKLAETKDEYTEHSLILECIREKINTKKNMSSYNPQKQIQKIEFMLNGAECYLPFSEPYDGLKFKLPLKNVHGQYSLEEVQIEKINMSQGIGGPYYAYQLTPTNQKEYFQPALIFMGTNPMPVASGPTVTVHADTISNKSVGENLVEGSKDLLEQILQKQFKENLRKLLNEAANNPNSNLRDTNGEIKYQEICMQARVKCVGQSLGGSISLQMLARFPHLAESAAFEPPFLTENYRRLIEDKLTKAHDQFSKLVEEIQLESPLPKDISIQQLKNAIPKDTEELKKIIKKNNLAITQFSDIVPKHGTVSPPLTRYHVDIDKELPKYKKTTGKIREKIYRATMGATVMSHAMALGGQNDKIIKELDLELETMGRRNLTYFLHKVVWKAVNPIVANYFSLKHFYLNNIHNPKMNPSKSPAFLEEYKKILENKVNGEIQIIEKIVNDLNNGMLIPGDVLIEKCSALNRMLEQAENLGLDITNEDNLELKDKLLSIINKIKTDEHKSIIINHIYPENIGSEKNKRLELENKIKSNIDYYIQTLQSVTSENQPIDDLKKQRRQILVDYTYLNNAHRKEILDFLKEKVKNNQLLVTTAPNSGLLNDLQSHAKSPRENKALGKLIRLQGKKLEKAELIVNNVHRTNSKATIEEKLQKIGVNSDGIRNLAGRLLISEMAASPKIKAEAKNERPHNDKRRNLLFSLSKAQASFSFDKKPPTPNDSVEISTHQRPKKNL